MPRKLHLRSEFAGEDGASGLPLNKPVRSLSASEKLRLIYTTGTENPQAPLSGRAFEGTGRFDFYVPPSHIPPPPPE